jgi:hypothetical protein
MPLGIRKEISRSSILEDKPTWVQIAKDVIFSVDFYKGLGENLKKACLMRNKRNS